MPIVRDDPNGVAKALVAAGNRIAYSVEVIEGEQQQREGPFDITADWRGASDEGATYRRRYGIPEIDTKRNFYPRVFHLQRMLVFEWARNACRDGWFEQRGIPRLAGDGEATQLEAEDINYLLFRGGVNDPLYIQYTPISTAQPTLPTRIAPTGLEAAKFPERHTYMTYRNDDLAAHGFDVTTPEGRSKYYHANAVRVRGEIAAGRINANLRPEESGYDFFNVDIPTMLDWDSVVWAGAAAAREAQPLAAVQGNPVTVTQAQQSDGTSLIRVDLQQGPALLSSSAALALARQLLEFVR